MKFHFDPRCRWCYLPARWLTRLQELGEIEVDWGLFSLEVLHLPDDDDPLELDAASGPALRAAVAVRAEYGPGAIGRFYLALGRRIWEQVPPAQDTRKAVFESLEEAGFDPRLGEQAMEDPATWVAVVTEHRSLIESTRSFGVPTILLDGGTGPAIFGPIIQHLPDDENAVELWRHVSWLARYEDFSELKRDRQGQPDLPAIKWRERQKAGAKPFG